MRIRSTDSRGHFRKVAIPGWVKQEVVQRVGGKPGERVTASCHYCNAAGEIWWPLTYTGKIGSHMVLSGLEFDHVHPEFHGGQTHPDNIVLACRSCNRGKGAKIILA